MVLQVLRNGQITLPSSVRRSMGIEAGDIAVVTTEGSRVILSFQKTIEVSQTWFWSEAWQAREKEAQADIRAGAVSSEPLTVDEMKAALGQKS